MITLSRRFAGGKGSDKIDASLRLEALGVIVENIDRRTHRGLRYRLLPKREALLKIWNALEHQHLRAGSNYVSAWISVFATLAACSGSDRVTPPAAQGLSKVNHIIVVMMENHSFDNYFGALPYVPGGPYHRSSSGCVPDDHRC